MTAVREGRPVTKNAVDWAGLKVAKINGTQRGAFLAAVLRLYRDLAMPGVYALGAGLCTR